jgi:hypothetical protein
MASLYQVCDVPDLGAAVLKVGVRIDQVVALRESRHWEEFVKWFHETCASDPSRVAKEYVQLLRMPKWFDAPIFKILRLLIPTAVGIANPLGGVILSAADMFGTQKLKEASPKYFIEELEQLAPDLRKSTLPWR